MDAGVYNFGGIPFFDEFRFALAATTEFFTAPKTFLAATVGARDLVPLTGAVVFKVSTMVYNF